MMQSPNSQNCSCGAFLLLIEACSPKNYCHMLLRMLASDNPSNDAEPQFAKLLLRSVPLLIEACSPKNYCSMLLQMPASDNPSNDAEPQFAKLLLRSVPLLIEACSPKNYCHMLLRMLAFDEHPARFMALHRYNFT